MKKTTATTFALGTLLVLMAFGGSTTAEEPQGNTVLVPTKVGVGAGFAHFDCGDPEDPKPKGGGPCGLGDDQALLPDTIFFLAVWGFNAKGTKEWNVYAVLIGTPEFPWVTVQQYCGGEEDWNVNPTPIGGPGTLDGTPVGCGVVEGKGMPGPQLSLTFVSGERPGAVFYEIERVCFAFGLFCSYGKNTFGTGFDAAIVYTPPRILDELP